jgi:hypothetical protein
VLNALDKIIDSLIGNKRVMLVLWMRKDKVTNEASTRFNLSLSSCKEETYVESYLLNLVLRILAVDHKLFYQWINALKL